MLLDPDHIKATPSRRRAECALCNRDDEYQFTFMDIVKIQDGDSRKLRVFVAVALLLGISIGITAAIIAETWSQ